MAKAQEAAARRRQERTAIATRGPPPPLRRDFRLPPELLPDLLMVWDFCQVGALARATELLPSVYHSYLLLVVDNSMFLSCLDLERILTPPDLI